MIVDNVVLSPSWVTGWEREFVMESAIADVASGASYARQRWPYPKRQFVIPYGNMRFDASASPNSPSVGELSSFIMRRGGNARGFLAWDLYDCLLNAVQIGIGDGSTEQFQIIQPFGDAFNSFNRTIYHPVPSGTDVPGQIVVSAGGNTTAPMTVTVNAVAKTENTDYAVDYAAVLSTWLTGTTYGLADYVTLNGVRYVSLTAGNVGNTPSSSPSDWAVSTFGLMTFFTAPGNADAILVTCLAYTPVRFTDDKISMDADSISVKSNVSLIELFYS